MGYTVAVKVLEQSVIGYRRQGSETVFKTVWLMADGSTQTTYSGNVYNYDKPQIVMIDYGAHCPSIELAQQEAHA